MPQESNIYIVQKNNNDTIIVHNVGVIKNKNSNEDLNDIGKPHFSLNKYLISNSEIQPPLPFTPIQRTSETGMFFVYFGIILLWSAFYQKNFKGLISIGKTFISNNALFKELNDKSGYNGLVSFGMFFSGIVVISIFFFQLIQNINIPFSWIDLLSSKTTIFFIGIFLIVILFVKTILILGSSFLFKTPQIFNTYLSLNIISIQMIGIFLLPLIVLISFSYTLNPAWLAILGITILSLSFFYRLIRLFFLGVKQTNSQVFHIILYICALEILPLLAFSRILFTKSL
jgi:hypothetical protein